MTFEELVKAYGKKTSREYVVARKELRRVFEFVTAELLAGREVAIPKFGRFKYRRSERRTTRVPTTLNSLPVVEVVVPAAWRVRFTPFAPLKGVFAEKP